MKDLLCTKTNWINQGKNPSTLADHRDGEGNEKLSTNEGVPVRDPASKALCHHPQDADVITVARRTPFPQSSVPASIDDK